MAPAVTALVLAGLGVEWGAEDRIMTFRGRVAGGAIVLEPGVDLPEGTVVRVEVETAAAAPGEYDELSRMIDLAGETGVADLATNIDHYLYGSPKVENR